MGKQEKVTIEQLLEKNNLSFESQVHLYLSKHIWRFIIGCIVLGGVFGFLITNLIYFEKFNRLDMAETKTDIIMRTSAEIKAILQKRGDPKDKIIIEKLESMQQSIDKLTHKKNNDKEVRK